MISPLQCLSLSLSFFPFLHNNETNRKKQQKKNQSHHRSPMPKANKTNKLLEDNDDLDWGRFIGSGIIFVFLLTSFCIAAAFLYFYLGIGLSNSNNSSGGQHHQHYAQSSSSSSSSSVLNGMQKDNVASSPNLPPGTSF